MASDIPYLLSAGNVPAVFEKMRNAGTPPKFTLDFLSKTLGFASSQDRGIPKILKRLGFLSQDGVPTQRYNEYKSASLGGRVLAQGLREGWNDLFLANQRVHELSTSEIADICKSVTGSGDSAAKKMASTFLALAKLADWTGVEDEAMPVGADEEAPASNSTPHDVTAKLAGTIGLHQDIHIHLPPTSDVSVYRAIFQALREELM